MQQGFRHFWIVLLCDREINGRNVFRVAVVWWCSEFKKGSSDSEIKISYFPFKILFVNLRNSFIAVLLDSPVQRGAAILCTIIQQRSAIHQRNQQFLRLLGIYRERQRRFARVLTMKIWIQSFGTHFRDLLNMTPVDALQKSPQIRSRMKSAQLALVEIQHFVNATFVLQLRHTKQKPFEMMPKMKQCA